MSDPVYIVTALETDKHVKVVVCLTARYKDTFPLIMTFLRNSKTALIPLLFGIEAHLSDVEVDIYVGNPSNFVTAGIQDTAVRPTGTSKIPLITACRMPVTECGTNTRSCAGRRWRYF